MNRAHLLRQGWRASRRLPSIELARHWSLFYPVVPFDPTLATLVVTDNCNGKCQACMQWKNRSTDELDLEEIAGALSQLRHLGIRGISISGGEPLLRDDLPEIVRLCSELRFDEVQVLTNGLLLTRDLAEDLVHSGVRTIGISLDGLRSTNDALRGIEGSFDKVVAAVEMLGELRESRGRPETYIATTLMKPTLDEIILVARLAQALRTKMNLNLMDGAPHFFPDDVSEYLIDDQERLDRLVYELHELRSTHRGLFLASHTHAAIEYIRGYFQDPRRADIPCVLGHVCIYIGAHGEVYSGCFVLEPLGSIRERRLDEIVHSPEYRARLREMFTKSCPGCSAHHSLNLLHHAPWIWDEIRWELRMKAASARRRLARASIDGAERPA
jgi:MoaA/NifB/PqqE/SkfB family radical SAM enzyme